jgi:hypothetical protein
MVMGDNGINNDKKCRQIDDNIDRRSDTAQCALPNGAHPWLHEKSLDAAIGRVPASYPPGGRHGQRCRKEKKH